MKKIMYANDSASIKMLTTIDDDADDDVDEICRSIYGVGLLAHTHTHKSGFASDFAQAKQRLQQLVVATGGPKAIIN